MTFTRVVLGTDEIPLVQLNRRRTSLTLYNTHASNIAYISNTRGTGTNGWPIPAGGSVGWKIPEDYPYDAVFGIASGATTYVHIYEGFGFIDPNWKLME